MMNRKINLFMKPGADSIPVHSRVESFFEEHGFKIYHLYQDDCAFNIVIGGDGSFLRAVHMSRFSAIPFVGINTGHLGFFQEISVSNLEEYLNLLIQGQFEISPLALLSAEIQTSSWTYHLKAVNEFVIQSNDFKMLHLNLSIDDVPFINSSGDGMIISTPAGSTAYNLSAGGSILHQTLSGYQVAAISPLRSRSYDSLPSSLVLPATSRTTLHTEPKDWDRIKIICDGQAHHFLEVKKITLYVPEETVQRVVFHRNWYWHNLREKLF